MDDQHRSAGEDGLGPPDGPGGSPWSRPADPPPAEPPPTETARLGDPGGGRGEGDHGGPPYGGDRGGPVPPGPDEHPTDVLGWGPGGQGGGYGYAEYGASAAPGRTTSPMRPAAFGSPAYAEPGFPPEPEPQRRGRRVGKVGAIVAGVCLLVIGLGGGYLVAVAMGFGDTTTGASSAARSTQNVSAPGSGGTQSPAPSGNGAGSAPAPGPAADAPFGSLGAGTGAKGAHGEGTGSNAALGVVASIDGDDFVVRTLDGDEDAVSTDDSTYIVTVRGVGGISKLAVGDLVFVGGKGRSDGSIKADMVLGGAFPELGAGTR